MVNIFFPIRRYYLHHVFTGFRFCQILASRTISSANAWGVLYPLIAISPEHSGMGTISSMKSKVSCSILKQFKLSVFVG